MTLLYLALAYLAGIALGQAAWNMGLIACAFPSRWWALFLLALPVTPLLNRLLPEPQASAPLRWPRSAGFRPPRRGLSPALWAGIVLCLAGGFWRYAAQPLYPCLTPADLGYWNAPDDEAREVVVEGYVWSYPSVRDAVQQVDIAAQRLWLDGDAHDVSGVARLTTRTAATYRYGQPVRARGFLAAPYAGEDGAYRDYLARRGVRSQLARASVEALDGPPRGMRLLRALYSLRARGEAAVNRLLPEPYAALANGMLLGIEAGIPNEVMDRFNATGTSHVIVISGSNVALIAGVLAGLFGRVMGRRRALIPVLAGIAAYALLVGGDMAVLRAALMGGLAVTAVWLGRRNTGLISLAAAAWLLTVVNPLTLWDVGFQLSAGATAGLILFTGPLARLMERLWPSAPGGASPFLAASAGDTGKRGVLRGLVEDGVVVSAAASLAVMPLIAHIFGRVSLIGLLANLLIVPVQPLITVWGSAGVLAAALGPTLPGQALLWIAWLGLFWTERIVTWTAALPFASVEVAHYGTGALLATYAALFGIHWRRAIVQWAARIFGVQTWNWRAALAQPVLLVVAGAAAVLVWAAAVAQPDGRLHVYFLDVGQGDAILMETPGGNQALIDGGISPQTLLAELGAVMPFWDRSLDLVLLTHPDGDHMIGQMALPSRFTIGGAVSTAACLGNEASADWRATLDAAAVPVHEQAAGGWIDLGDGVALWVIGPDPGGYIGPDPENENSLVLKLVYGDFSALLTGDAGLASEADWLAQGAPLASTVLKAGHHGSKTSTGGAFVQAVDPQIAVIQVGGDNRYGHPHAEALENLGGRRVLRTDRHGRVHISSDGRRMWVETERAETGM